MTVRSISDTIHHKQQIAKITLPANKGKSEKIDKTGCFFDLSLSADDFALKASE
jgi:hypothetical protein